MAEDQGITLYNKYRPHKFRDVIGQEHITKGLQEAVLSNRLSHAYLLVGVRGTGKTTTARIIAAAANCMNLQKDGEPCGECDACLQTISGNWPGVLHEMDAASNRGVGDIQNLISQVSLGTTANYKVYIIDEVHLLTREAAAALLKTLEEPPRGVIFILATTDPHKLLDTIRSRSTELRLKSINRSNLRKITEEIIEKEGFDLEPDLVDQVIAEGNGSARDTISKLAAAEMGALDDSLAQFGHISSRLAEKDVSGLFLTVHQLDQEGNLDAMRVSEKLIELYESALLIQQDPDLPVTCSKESLGHAKQIAKDNTQARLVRNIRSIAETMSLMKISVNNKPLLETTLAQLVSPTARAATDSIMDSQDEVLERLTAIEKAIEKLRSDMAAPAMARTETSSASHWANDDLSSSTEAEAPEPEAEGEPESNPEPEPEKPKRSSKKRGTKKEKPEPEPEPEEGGEKQPWEENPDEFLSDLATEFRGRVSVILSGAELLVEDGVPVIVSDSVITSNAQSKINAKFGVECEYRSS